MQLHRVCNKVLKLSNIKIVWLSLINCFVTVRKYLNILTVQIWQRTLTAPPTHYSLMNVMCKIEIEYNS